MITALFFITRAPMAQITEEIRVHAVDNKHRLDDFLHLPEAIYKSDPHWISPLIIEQKQRYSDKNPFFEHARWQAFVAYRGDRPVGRISAQIDDLHLQRHKNQTGHFGALEAEQDGEIFTRLFEAASAWLRNAGMRRITGPFNLSINEECGALIEGFDTPPCIMMGHGRPWYGENIERQGFVKAKDLIAYWIAPEFESPKVMLALARKASKRVRVRPINRKAIKQELAVMRSIFNDAWSENWGFVPFTEAEFNEVGKAMTLLLDDDFVQIAEVDGEPAAMMVALPNVNEAIRDLHGRLLPFGWAKLLWRLKVSFPTTARVPLLGVRKQYQHSRLGPTLAFMIIDAVRQGLLRKGVTGAELSWILEDNSGMRSIIEKIGGVAYKRYRLYEKTLA